MNRVFTGALIAAALLLLSHRPASAMVEFCPAMLSYERVGNDAALIRQQSSKDAMGKSSTQTSTLYGFELSAFGPRTLTSVTLAFDTSAGWFTVDVPGVTLVEKDRHYSAPWVSFVRRDYVSPAFYVHFPKAVDVPRAWVLTAATQGDSLFEWDKQGTVQCDPSPQRAYTIAVDTGKPPLGLHSRPAFYKLEPHDEDNLSVPPPATALILAARSSEPLETSTCAQPFRDAMVKAQAQPAYPEIMRGEPTGERTTSVMVGIDADGSLSDAWVWGPSGFQAFDDAALRAARTSKYTGPAAYCKPVPGFYFFRVTFDPNG